MFGEMAAGMELVLAVRINRDPACIRTKPPPLGASLAS